MNARGLLRSETREAHEALDAHFSQFDLSDARDYGAFLLAHAAAFLPIEEALTEAGAARLFPEWDGMVRAGWLVRDLEALGLEMPAPIAPPAFDSDAAIVGGAYVLEGSRLGGTVLRKAVGADLPHDYLSHDPSLRWPEFVAQIERILKNDVDRSQAVASANAVFACFLRAATAVEVGGA